MTLKYKVVTEFSDEKNFPQNSEVKQKITELSLNFKISNITYQLDNLHNRATMICDFDSFETVKEFATFMHDNAQKHGYMLICIGNNDYKK